MNWLLAPLFSKCRGIPLRFTARLNDGIYTYAFMIIALHIFFCFYYAKETTREKTKLGKETKCNFLRLH